MPFVVLDKTTGRPYINNKSWDCAKQAQSILRELLKYHADWKNRLVITEVETHLSAPVKAEIDGRIYNGKPKGCKGNGILPKPKRKGHEYFAKLYVRSTQSCGGYSS